MQITPEAHVVFQIPSPRKSIDWAAWAGAWPDALAFAVGLGVARWAGWTAGDLIWSLWLSSLVVGFTTIFWMILSPTAVFTGLAWKSRNELGNTSGSAFTFIAIILAGAAFMLAFFSVHFGGFHYVHSGFLLYWFPIDVPGVAYPELGGKAVYLEVLRRYWVFLPSAFLSHRAVFMRAPLTLDAKRWFESFVGEKGKSAGEFFTEPYRNVLRMHGLIFFFAFAHFAGLENFAMYTVIYAVYFFPWRLVRAESSAA
jgi:hypothetical protein